ncbi:related to PDR16-involved in lipid biosynthesis and multidrug resistance [Sporisorium reilianum SRZ2]|uniref:Related to PDR16-involved in lipid biosynthesis and multidrug resistance n=1 Tax=Sporisorium reilianum (strain SRZ2) TaxID=999809 RepID=E6ZMY8_SPORE|nr:related to PDR16-involved in lipid biosynthesis and multidrug resistance [Sporisorium reilianum SRZ2]
MSFDANHLSKTDSRASSTRSSLFTRASGFVLGPSSRRNPTTTTTAATASSSSSSTPNMQSNAAFSSTPMSENGGDAAGPRKFDHIFPAPAPSVKLTPPAPLSESQQEKYEQMLQHFQSTHEYPTSLKHNSPKKPLDEWETMRNLSKESMIRYLRATKWDVASAKKRLTDTIAWRREYGVDSLKAEDLEPEAMTGKETILGYDNKGRPLHYMHPSRNTTEETPRQMQYAVWILERAIDLMPPGVEMLALLINFGGKKRNPTSLSNAKLMLYILQNHYVERLGIALCINVPWIFKAFWNAIYPFIDPVTKGKCKFDEAIKHEVPNAQLASDFCGLLDFTYEHDKYWPQLVELTDRRRAEQLERFRTLCNAQIGASEWVIRGGDELGRSTVPHKQDSGFHEVDAMEGAAVEKAAPTYRSAAATPGGEEESQLDRFYTTQTELPPQLESQLESGEASDSENATAVHDEQHHAAGGADDASAKQHKHGDASLFAAVVGGISSGLVGGKAASDAAEEASKAADREAHVHGKQDTQHEKHHHLKQIKAVFHRRSESRERASPAISAS